MFVDNQTGRRNTMKRHKFLSIFIFFLLVCITRTSSAKSFAISQLANQYPPEIKYASFHHSEVRASDNSRQLHSVNNFHKDKWGVKSLLGWYVGYNWFCDVDGSLTQTRKVGETTLAQLYHNDDTESICLAGNFNKDMPTMVQQGVLRQWILERSFLEFKFHRDLNRNRTCPGTNITKQWIHELFNGSSNKKLEKNKSSIPSPVIISNDQLALQKKRNKLFLMIINGSSASIKTGCEIIDLRIKRAFGTITPEETNLLETLIEERSRKTPSHEDH